MKKKIIGYSVVGLFVIFLAVFAAFVLSLRYGQRIIDLRRLDEAAYTNCKKLLNHPLVKTKDVRFFVYFGEDIFPKKYNKINAFSIANFINGKPEFDHIIVFSPGIIKSGCIEMATAHDLGHINLKTADESLVDEFMVKVLGNKKKIIDCLIKVGEPPDSERILALSEQNDTAQ